MFADRTNWDLTPNRLSQTLAAHRASGKKLLDLTCSNPTQCGFHYEEHTIREALASQRALLYEPDPKGMASARSAVAAYYAERDAPVSSDDIFLTTSTSEAYSFVFRLLCNASDEILVPYPSYPLFDFLAEIQDVKLVRYPLLYDCGWRTDFQALERAISKRTRGIIVVHPNNPTGHFTGASEAQRLNEICAVNGIALIADEVFLDFALDAQPRASFASKRDALTFTMGGLSKLSGLPQMKVSWLVVSGRHELKEQALARLEIIADTYLSMNAPVQLALPLLLKQRFRFQEQLMPRVRENLAELDRQLAGQHSCKRLEMEGGWYAVLQSAAMSDDEEFAVELIERCSVYVHPGHYYEFSAGHLIVSLIVPKKDLAVGAKLLLAAMDE